MQDIALTALCAPVVGEEVLMLWTLISLLVAFWVIGLLAHIGGGFIHFLLGAAVLLFLVNLFTGSRMTV
jgi:hypothetical protein